MPPLLTPHTPHACMHQANFSLFSFYVVVFVSSYLLIPSTSFHAQMRLSDSILAGMSRDSFPLNPIQSDHRHQQQQPAIQRLQLHIKTAFQFFDVVSVSSTFDNLQLCCILHLIFVRFRFLDGFLCCSFSMNKTRTKSSSNSRHFFLFSLHNYNLRYINFTIFIAAAASELDMVWRVWGERRVNWKRRQQRKKRKNNKKITIIIRRRSV